MIYQIWSLRAKSVIYVLIDSPDKSSNLSVNSPVSLEISVLIMRRLQLMILSSRLKLNILVRIKAGYNYVNLLKSPGYIVTSPSASTSISLAKSLSSDSNRYSLPVSRQV